MIKCKQSDIRETIATNSATDLAYCDPDFLSGLLDAGSLEYYSVGKAGPNGFIIVRDGSWYSIVKKTTNFYRIALYYGMVDA